MQNTEIEDVGRIVRRANIEHVEQIHLCRRFVVVEGRENLPVRLERGLEMYLSKIVQSCPSYISVRLNSGNGVALLI